MTRVIASYALREGGVRIHNLHLAAGCTGPWAYVPMDSTLGYV